MSEHTSYRLGPDGPDEEELHDSHGRVIDEGYVEDAVEEAIDQVDGRGRPSLSGGGESPLLRVRLPRSIKPEPVKAVPSPCEAPSVGIVS